MVPFIVLVGVTSLLFVLGRLGVPRLRTWPVPLRGGVAAMFLLTAAAHFLPGREDLVRMVPPALPAPELLVTVTGRLELAGAAACSCPARRGQRPSGWRSCSRLCSRRTCRPRSRG